MIVMELSTYDVILGNNWLRKAKAKLKYNDSTLVLYHHGKKHVIPIDFNRGFPLNQEEDTDDEDDTNSPPLDYHTDSEEGEVYTVFGNQQDPIERHTRASRQFTKQHPPRKPKTTSCQYPAYQQNESEEEQPNWIKHNCESYSSGEEEAFFRIPDRIHRTMFVGLSTSSNLGKTPSVHYQINDPPTKHTL